MKKFIFLSLLYVSFPMLGGILNTFFLQLNQGDLVRLGKLYQNDLPREQMESERSRKYQTLNEINLKEENVFDYLTIGDSFSNFHNGYQNYLVESGYKVVNCEHKRSSNPIQELIDLINSGLFDRVQVNVVVLESIERNLNKRCSDLDFKKRSNIDSLYNSSWVQRKTRKELNSYNFFSLATVTAPILNVAYLFVATPPMSDTYKFSLRDGSLFSPETFELLVYKQDIEKMASKNSKSETIHSVNVLNRISKTLEKKGIELMVMIPPDKFDLFYDKIDAEDKIRTPKFYENYNSLGKHYIDVPVYSKFVSALNHGVKNLYFYDDSHWSPVGQEMAADMIGSYQK